MSTVPIAIDTNSASAITAIDSLTARLPASSSAARIFLSVMSTTRTPRQRPRASRRGRPATSLSGMYAETELTPNVSSCTKSGSNWRVQSVSARRSSGMSATSYSFAK